MRPHRGMNMTCHTQINRDGDRYEPTSQLPLTTDGRGGDFDDVGNCLFLAITHLVTAVVFFVLGAWWF